MKMKGVIAAGGQLTAEAGAAILRQGGNAVDAAIAAAFASFIAEIGMVHLGGSGIAQIYDAQSGQSTVFDFFTNMPGLGTDRLPDDLNFEPVMIDFGTTTQSFHLGRAAVSVPSNIFGLCAMAEQFGTLALATLLEPALALARDGLVLNDYQASICTLLQSLYTHTASMRSIFWTRNRMAQAGERIQIAHLHETLQQLKVKGSSLLRSGSLAKALTEDHAQRGGLVTPTDLAQYEVRLGTPVTVSYRAFDVLLPAQSSVGGVLIGFTLKLLGAFDSAENIHAPAAYQLFFEAMEATSRARHYVEQTPTFPIEQILSPTFITPYIEQVKQALQTRSPFAPVPPAEGPSHTSHLSVIDSNGMAVTLTTTAGESAGYVVPNTGFIPNNMLGEKDLNPHGWHKHPAGQRLPTMMAPTLLMKAGKVVVATGSGGSERIRSAIVQVVRNFVDYGLPLDEAVMHPRLHIQEGVMQCEAGFEEATIQQLEAWGYKCNRWPNRSMYFGGAHSVGIVEGQLLPAADPRRDGYTIVV
ncbi:MAG: gamma-glutamyltransferase [Candidatus Promineifilaceae bacterium]